MTIPRILLPFPMTAGSLCELRREDQRYIRSVLRLKKNDHLVLFDGQGHEYQAMIRQVEGDRTVVEILKKYPIREKPLRITLLQALPKAGKMDFIIQKATELGVDRIVPFQAARSVSRLTQDQKRQKQTRWHKIAVEAARQCGRADVPAIGPCLDFEEMIGTADAGGVKLIFWEEETRAALRNFLKENAPGPHKDYFVMVGPEGGFSKEEVGRARESGFESVSLGRQILRVDTAVVAILAILQYERGILAEPSHAGSKR